MVYAIGRPRRPHNSNRIFYDYAMKKIFAAMALAFALTTVMAVTTVIAYTG